MRSLKPILLVEDDDVDAMTVKRSLEDLEVANALVHLLNGEEALKYLRDGHNEKPCVILLDLNMPKMSGIEFLKIIKANNRLKKIPIVILTTSNEKQDIAETFSLGVSGYMVKPLDYRKFLKTIETIFLYWESSRIPEIERGIADEEPQTNNAC